MSVEFADLTPEDRVHAIPPGVNTTSPGGAMFMARAGFAVRHLRREVSDMEEQGRSGFHASCR
jgi:hypothetical protein